MSADAQRLAFAESRSAIPVTAFHLHPMPSDSTLDSGWLQAESCQLSFYCSSAVSLASGARGTLQSRILQFWLNLEASAFQTVPRRQSLFNSIQLISLLMR